MKNKLLLVAAFLGCSLTAFSQTDDSASYKHQLGIIASPSLQYLFQNKSLPVGLIYKRQVKADQAWRLTITGRYNNENYPNGPYGSNSNYLVQKSTNYFAQALIGYEWQKELNKRWTFYYGIDAGAGYSRYKSEYDFTNYTPNQFETYGFGYGKGASQYYILQPMAGIKFNLTSRLYLATETNIALTYSRSQHKNVQTNFTGDQSPVTTESPGFTASSTNLRYSPLSNIQFVYKF